MRADKIAAPPAYALRDQFPERRVRRGAILKLTGRRVRGLDQHKDATPRASARDKWRERVAAEIGIDGHRVAGKIALTEKGLGVSGGSRTDIAALRVGDDDQSQRSRKLDDFDERA